MLEDIRGRFGDRVAMIVDGLHRYQRGAQAAVARAQGNVHRASARRARGRPARVPAADKLHNARSILSDLRREGDAVWDRFTADREGVLWYYDALLAAYQARGGSRLAEELERVLAEIHSIVRGGGRP